MEAFHLSPELAQVLVRSILVLISSASTLIWLLSRSELMNGQIIMTTWWLSELAFSLVAAELLPVPQVFTFGLGMSAFGIGILTMHRLITASYMENLRKRDLLVAFTLGTTLLNIIPIVGVAGV